MFFIPEWSLPTDTPYSRMSWWTVFHFTEHSQMPKCKWFILGYYCCCSCPSQSHNYIFYMYLPSVQEEGKGVLSNVLYYIHQGTLYLSPETLSGLELANQLSPLSSAFIEYVIYYGFHCLALRVNTLLFFFYYFILMRFQEGK